MSFSYDYNAPPYIFEHLAPLQRVLPGRIVALPGPPGHPDETRRRFEEARVLGFTGTASVLTAAELEGIYASSTEFLVGMGLDWERPRRAKDKERQYVQLFHGIDLLGVARDRIRDGTPFKPEEDQYRGEGARTHQTRYPPLCFSRSLARPSCRAELEGPPGGPPTLVLACGVANDTGIPTFRGDDWKGFDFGTQLKALTKEYRVLFVDHPAAKLTKDVPAPADHFVKVSPELSAKVGWQTIGHLADAFIVDEDSSVATYALAFGKPVVGILPEPLLSAVKRNMPENSYLNDENAVMVTNTDVAAVNLGEAVKAALDGDTAKRLLRHRLFQRIVGCIDGYEEFRVAFLVLRHFLESSGHAAEELTPLYEAYGKLSVVGPAGGISYRKGLCDPSDPLVVEPE